MNSEGIQSYRYMLPFSSKLLSHPGYHIKQWAEFPVLHSRSLLVIHLKCSSVYMSIPNSLAIPSPHPFPSLLDSWALFSATYSFMSSLLQTSDKSSYPNYSLLETQMPRSHIGWNCFLWCASEFLFFSIKCIFSLHLPVLQIAYQPKCTSSS